MGVVKWEVDHTCMQGILSHTSSPERTDVSERIRTETQEDVTCVRNVPTVCGTNMFMTKADFPLLYLWHSKCQTVQEKREHLYE